MPSLKHLAFLPAVLALILFTACGGGGPANPGSGAAGFTNASFSGKYVFTMSGQCVTACSSSVIQSIGNIVADGNGNITGGNWDLNIGGSYQSSAIPFTGSYSVNQDGTATVSLDITNVGTASYVIMLTGPEGGYITSSDSNWTLAGVLEKQGSSALTTPTGNYVFHAHGLTSSLQSWAAAGAMNFGNTSVVADLNQNGTALNLGTGTIVNSVFDASTGRGTFTVDPAGNTPLPTMNFVYYTVDGNSMELLSADASLGMQGRAEVSTGTVASPLSGSFAFLGAGYPVTGNVQVSEGGVFKGDGAGNITSGSLDTVFDSNGNLDQTLTATGSASAVNNVTRDVLNLTPETSLGMTHATLWMVNASRGFFLTTNTDRAETGTINSQSAASYSGDGTFAYFQTGWDLTSGTQALNSVTLFKSSGGTVSGYTQSVNFGGSVNITTGTGTLSFQNTVGSLTINDRLAGSEQFRIYQYSPTQAFIMETNQGQVTSGSLSAQTSQ